MCSNHQTFLRRAGISLSRAVLVTCNLYTYIRVASVTSRREIRLCQSMIVVSPARDRPTYVPTPTMALSRVAVASSLLRTCSTPAPR